MFDVVFYEKLDNLKPAEEYILGEEIKMQAKIFRNLNLLSEFGNRLRMPYSREIEDGIFELRTQVGNDISRVLYFFIVGKTIVLTNGFRKKTEKTPKSEIDLAKKYRNDFLDRNKVTDGE